MCYYKKPNASCVGTRPKAAAENAPRESPAEDHAVHAFNSDWNTERLCEEGM